MSVSSTDSDNAPRYATVLADPNRIIFGARFAEEFATIRPLPGTPSPRGASTYLPLDIAMRPRYAHDEDGWTTVPSERVMKRRARRAALRQERKGWLGSASASFQEPTSSADTIQAI